MRGMVSGPGIHHSAQRAVTNSVIAALYFPCTSGHSQHHLSRTRLHPYPRCQNGSPRCLRRGGSHEPSLEPESGTLRFRGSRYALIARHSSEMQKPAGSQRVEADHVAGQGTWSEERETESKVRQLGPDRTGEDVECDSFAQARQGPFSRPPGISRRSLLENHAA